MSVPKLIHLHTSPFSERVRWAFDAKGVPYEKVSYAVVAGEEELAKLTGQRQVPVLLVDGLVIPDSTAILEWLEAYAPSMPLLPAKNRDRAQAMLYEELACAVLGPEARHLAIARMLEGRDPRLVQYGGFLGRKYGHSELADMTVAAMLMVVRPAPDELFVCSPASMRPIFEDPMHAEPQFAELFAYRDRIYGDHRGGRVTP